MVILDDEKGLLWGTGTEAADKWTPCAFVVLTYSGTHYRLLKSAEKRRFDFRELPQLLQTAVRNAGGSYKELELPPIPMPNNPPQAANENNDAQANENNDAGAVSPPPKRRRVEDSEEDSEEDSNEDSVVDDDEDTLEQVLAVSPS